MVEVGVCSVIDILNGGDRVAVYSVVDATTVYRTIAALKSLGASGILVTQLSKSDPRIDATVGVRAR